MSSLAQMIADTASFLAEWGETLTRQRRSTTYDSAGRGTDSWGTGVGFTGDFEPLSGDDVRAESGLQQKSEGKIMAEYNADVLQGDRVIRGSVTYRIGYTQDLPDQKLCFVYREVNP